MQRQRSSTRSRGRSDGHFLSARKPGTANPDLALEIMRRGHEMGLHGHDHVRHDRIDAALSAQDIELTAPLRSKRCSGSAAAGTAPHTARCPQRAEACRTLGLTVVYWSAWGLDWEDVVADRIADVRRHPDR